MPVAILTCASAGWAPSSAAPAAAASAARFKALAATMFPHLDLVAFGAAIDLDAAVDRRRSALLRGRAAHRDARRRRAGDLRRAAAHGAADCTAEAADHGRRRI